MKHSAMWLMVLVLVACGAVQVANAQGPAGDPEGVGMMQCPSMVVMGAADTAAWGGSVYVLQGTTLTKLDRTGKTVKAVELPDLSARLKRMHEMRLCPMMGMVDRTGRPGAKGPGQRGGNGPGMHGGNGPGPMGRRGPGPMGDKGPGPMPPIERMHRMHTMRMMSAATVTADGDGVYVLRVGEMTVYDHDLNMVSSAQVIALDTDPANCPVCQRAAAEMEAGGGPTCPAIAESTGPWGPNPNSGDLERPQTVGFSQPITRAIVAGEVMLQNDPVCPTGGLVTLYLGVLDINGDPTSGTKVSAYIYPNDSPGGGQGVDLTRSRRGAYFTGEAELTGSGPWELAVRVQRPGLADAKVYYALGMPQ